MRKRGHNIEFYAEEENDRASLERIDALGWYVEAFLLHDSLELFFLHRRYAAGIFAALLSVTGALSRMIMVRKRRKIDRGGRQS